MKLILIVDNYDSFVYNIAQIVGELGGAPIVVRNDELSIKAVERIDPDAIIISPGPGTPERREDIGVSIDIVKRFYRSTPILGICLGHQIIGYAFGSRIRRARTIMHGKISQIEILSDVEIFRGVPKIIKATRYHSLVVDSPPPEMIVAAMSIDDEEIMALAHTKYHVYGVQFHPESIETKYGKKILKNFIDLV
ncbi:aminodeoxychorismate/anthranilate synthase component II [Ignisphaera sp. 4213-co]|uniref:anthranilate synthase n=1 Tax=Ignisphaera cupida TaxID=3050454 RepID=A0ABD4Z537_9CREN|nr:aminodeoxychorismate/anthranilate synthase component II [Ignisphaera sp. 4213-co]MDK6028082.1 aminodeoxychorismate/anthranilate synthase component II [Ignisphaera sp. 4213-co]